MPPVPPLERPSNPCFSSGPCPKRPGWSTTALDDALVGRSHRSTPGKDRLKSAIERTRALLEIPADYRIGIMPGSDTGAIEAAMWTLLGPRGVDVLAWDSFGGDWVTDVVDELGIEDARVLRADFGDIPDLGQVDFERDVVFTWNGTTSGVRVPDGDWIAVDRKGLTICDATSAVFAMPMPWERIDVATFSWQKVLGGEAAHGMLVLSPRVAERVAAFTPPRPIPKLFRFSRKGRLVEGVFEGNTINTPSMVCVEDYLDALAWAASQGGLAGLIARSRSNLAVIEEWVARRDWVAFLAASEAIRSNTSICLKIVAPWFTALTAEEQRKVTGRVATLLDAQAAAYDINGYRDAPPGFRVWGGATVEADDVRRLLPWIDWAYETVAGER